MLLKELIKPELALSLIEDALSCANHRRVNVVGNDLTTWDEYELTNCSNLLEILTSRRVIDAVEIEIGGEISFYRAWLNVYKSGEYIDWHTDCAGDIQLILLLDGSIEGEGQLMIRENGNAPVVVDLKVGDAFLFNATRVEHRTTPILRTGARRITAVARFFKAAN